MRGSYKNSFNKFLKINKRFYSDPDKYSNYALVLSVTNNLIFNTILLKFSKAISETYNYKILSIPSIRYASEINSLNSSFKIDLFISHIHYGIKLFLSNFFKIIYHLIKIKDGDILEKYFIDNIPVGKHIYDYLLIRHKTPTLNKISLHQKFSIIICLYYYYLFNHLISKFKPKTIISLDNAYIEGILFEIAKYYNIETYTGFDINLLTLHNYRSTESFKFHCRTPDYRFTDSLFKSKDYLLRAESFLKLRFSGYHNQHDAKRSFSKDKMQISRNDFIKKYNLNDNKPIVLITPHIFSDAPHAYPDVIYKDYYCWFVDTLKVLDKNLNCNIVVKEHPSAELYEELGYVYKIINKLELKNIKLVDNEINSFSLMKIVDTLITCGGTSGMEYAYSGTSVIVCASPPYINYDFVNRVDSIDEYHKLLQNITNLKKPNDIQRILAGNLLYLFFNFYGIDKNSAKLNNYVINRGEENDLNKFFSFLSKYDNIKDSHVEITNAINYMKKNKLTNIYKHNGFDND